MKNIIQKGINVPCVTSRNMKCFMKYFRLNITHGSSVENALYLARIGIDVKLDTFHADAPDAEIGK